MVEDISGTERPLPVRKDGKCCIHSVNLVPV